MFIRASACPVGRRALAASTCPAYTSTPTGVRCWAPTRGKRCSCRYYRDESRTPQQPIARGPAASLVGRSRRTRHEKTEQRSRPRRAEAVKEMRQSAHSMDCQQAWESDCSTVLRQDEVGPHRRRPVVGSPLLSRKRRGRFCFSWTPSRAPRTTLSQEFSSRE